MLCPFTGCFKDCQTQGKQTQNPLAVDSGICCNGSQAIARTRLFIGGAVFVGHDGTPHSKRNPAQAQSKAGTNQRMLLVFSFNTPTYPMEGELQTMLKKRTWKALHFGG
jgi:hypothetical protein